MSPAVSLIAQLFDALKVRSDALARHATHGDPPDKAPHDPQVRAANKTVARIAKALAAATARPPRVSASKPPPRAVGVAMARALFSAPHVASTLSAVPTRSDAARIVPSPELAEALGLPAWELDELREEIDRGASQTLVHARVGSWLWHRFGSPARDPGPLFRTLFPAQADLDPVGFRRAGARLYAVIERPSPGRTALYLRHSRTGTLRPDDTFDPHQLDASAVRSLARSLGQTDDDTRKQLAAVVSVVPHSQENAFLAFDRWRAEGWAELCSLGMAAPTPGWVEQPIDPSAIDIATLVTLDDKGHLDTRNARRTFDRHAMARVTAVARQRYAAVLATHLTGPASTAAVADHELAECLDLGPAIQRALQPLFDWLDAPETLAHAASALRVSQSAAAPALRRVRDGWLDAARGSWGGPPTEAYPHTVQTLLLTHLMLFQHALARLGTTQADPRAPHARVLPLFAGHFLAHAPIGRLWRAKDGQLPKPEDVLSSWFWPLWTRALDLATPAPAPTTA